MEAVRQCPSWYTSRTVSGWHSRSGQSEETMTRGMVEEEQRLTRQELVPVQSWTFFLEGSV